MNNKYVDETASGSQNQERLISSKPLAGKRIAILAADGFQEDELVVPKERLFRAGALISVVSPKRSSIKSQPTSRYKVPVDVHVADARASDFDALVIPGGLKNPDTLRADETCVEFVKECCDAPDTLVAAICHAPWVLIEADSVRGKRVTSYKSIKTDLKNAGAEWIDQEVVHDGALITSRKPADLKAFCNKIQEYLTSSDQSRAGATVAVATSSRLDVMASEDSGMFVGSYEDLENAEMRDQTSNGLGMTDGGYAGAGEIDENRHDEILMDVYANETVSVDLVIDDSSEPNIRANQEIADEKL